MKSGFQLSVESNFANALVCFTAQSVIFWRQTNRGFLAWRRLHVFTSCSDWFNALFASVVIGQGNNCTGFGLTTLK